MKIKNERGFTAVEGLIILLVVVALGGAGYYVWNKNQNKKPVSVGSIASAPKPQAYIKTTTVPTGWKTYSNAMYKFSFSYMPTWTVTVAAGTALSPSDNQVANVDLTSLSPAQSKGTLAGEGMTINVYKQSLAKTLAYERSIIQSAQQQTADANKPLNFSTTNLTFDGNTVIKYMYPSSSATELTSYIIYSNGYSYNINLLNSNSDKTNPISKNTLTSFESLKFSSSTSATSPQKYLTIKEWGVRVPMPSNVRINDIFYLLKTDSVTDSPYADLGSVNLGKLVSNCDIKSSTGATPLGWIERMTPTAYNKAEADYTNTGVTSGALLNGYYYVWQAPRGSCFEVPADSNPKLMTQISALSDSNDQHVDNFPANMPTVLKSIQAIP